MNLRSDDLSWRDVEDDVVVLDERTWTYVHLNAAASVLWRSLAQGADELQLVEKLATAFPDASDPVADVSAFLVDLRRREYLVA